MFGQYEFVVRRAHSLLGLVPVGTFLIIHLATNGSIWDGPQIFQQRVLQIHSVGPSTLFLLEWLFIFLPILLHGVVGMMIVMRGKRNVNHYPYVSNIRYTAQRATGVLAMAFILWHVFHMHGWLRFEWWHTYVAGPLGGAQFDPHRAGATIAAAVQASWLITAIYAAGVLASVYHFANGLWTMGITWGVWSTPHAQRWANAPCALFGLALTILGLVALIGIYRIEPDKSAAHSAPPVVRAAGQVPRAAVNGPMVNAPKESM